MTTTKTIYDTVPICANTSFQQLFKTENMRKPGKDIYNDVFNSPCFPLQRKNELQAMIQIAKINPPKVIYEIGTSRGGGLYHWCKCCPSAKRIIACDVGGIPYASTFEEYFPHLDFLWLEKSSWANPTIQKVFNWLGNDKIDILFIDGNKTRKPHDFDAYLPLMSKGGIVFVHDVNGGGLATSFREIQQRGYHTKTIIDTSESTEAVQREEKGVPATNGYERWLRHWKGKSAGVGVIYLNGD